MKYLFTEDNHSSLNPSGQRFNPNEHAENAYIELEKKFQETTVDLAVALGIRDEFLTIASHELKTPLTSLKLRLQMGKRNLRPEINKMPTKEELDKIYSQALDQVDSLVNLVEDLLDVSRIQSGEFNLIKRRLNLSDLVLKVVRRFQNNFQSSEFQINIAPDLFAQADPYRIEQAVSKLIVNALKYAPGSIIEVNLCLSTDEENIQLIVKDNGPGIEISKQDQIFERFERLSSYRHVSGLGLGLYMVKNIIGSHGGEVTLLSYPGKGSSFVVHLPVEK